MIKAGIEHKIKLLSVLSTSHTVLRVNKFNKLNCLIMKAIRPMC